MSRSTRKTSVTGIGKAESEKSFKRYSNKVLRQRQKAALRKDDSTLPTRPRDVVETYTGPKDGKMRFDPQRYPELMRK